MNESEELREARASMLVVHPYGCENEGQFLLINAVLSAGFRQKDGTMLPEEGSF